MSLHRAAALGTLVLASVAPSLAAQEPFDSIAYSETQAGILSVTNDTLQDGSYYRAYTFMGRNGDSVTVWLSSRDFNAHLMLADSLDNVMQSDDDGGGACDAYLTSVLPADGRYIIYANTAGQGELGQFQLTLRRGIHPPNSREPCRGFVGHSGVLGVGDIVAGRIGPDDRVLPDSSHFQVWLLPAIGARPLTVELVSEDFDAALILVRGFGDVLDVNDDGAGGCNARIVHTPIDTRPLRVVVIARGPSQVGAFTLGVTEGAVPITSQPPCDRGP